MSGRGVRGMSSRQARREREWRLGLWVGGLLLLGLFVADVEWIPQVPIAWLSGWLMHGGALKWFHDRTGQMPWERE